MSKKRKSVRERFWSKVDKGGARASHMKTCCWNWTGYIDAGGYGQINIDRKAHRTHRISWVLAHGRKVPKWRVVRHRCDVPSCVRPSHLQLGTYKQNSQDAIKRGRMVRIGEDNPNAKLTNEEVIEIRERHTLGISQFAIAGEYGVSPSRISLIVNFESRKTA